MRTKDRRTFIRITAYHLAKYKVSPEAGSHAVPVLTFLRDIGAGGVRLKTNERLQLLSILQLKINFPSLRDPVFTLAKVVWIKQTGKNKDYEVGLQFVEIDDLVRGLVDKKLKSVYEKAQRHKKA